MNLIRTRYAPSPTGNLHIGGARTALFNYLYAKKMNGSFIVRIEDTDVKRNVKNGIDLQLNNLEWLGIFPDESPKNEIPKYGPYTQSQKLDRYHKIISELIDKKMAYKAYDTPQELDAQKSEQLINGITSFRYDPNWLKLSEKEKQVRDENGQYVIRLKINKSESFEWLDIVRGKINISSSEVSDFVILKQDKFPTYNLAVVVDDHDMEITDVLRGEEHITNTPRQIAIYKSLNWEVPRFGHLTIITNFEGKKLSKRDHSVKQFIDDYKSRGYNSHGIVNFMALLGWTSKSKKEVFDLNELIGEFSLERLSKAPSKFDNQKLEWFSKKHFQKMELNEFQKLISKPKEKSNGWFELFINTFKDSTIATNDLEKVLQKYLKNEIKDQNPMLENDAVKSFVSNLKEKNFTIEEIQKAINQASSETNLKGKKLFFPIRIATTYEEHGPELAKAIFLFGKETIFERLKVN